MPLKSISYAYPTSSAAHKFGYGITGCYVVETFTVTDGKAETVILSGHATKEEALTIAKQMPHDWTPWFKQWHPGC